jgi:hypothetical protein
MPETAGFWFVVYMPAWSTVPIAFWMLNIKKGAPRHDGTHPLSTVQAIIFSCADVIMKD